MYQNRIGESLFKRANQVSHGHLWSQEESGVKYMWVYRTSGHTQSFARYSVSDTGGLKEEIHTDVLAASYNGESTDEFNKYRLYFNVFTS